jgi:hypothetical protein
MLAFTKSKDIIVQTTRFTRRHISLGFKFKGESLILRLSYIKVSLINRANDIPTFLVRLLILKISSNKIEYNVLTFLVKLLILKISFSKNRARYSNLFS